MHPGAFEFIRRYATEEHLRVIEIGSRDINGGVRILFPQSEWTGLDLHPGTGVDVVCDASEWKNSFQADRVICCEVFEHCHKWRDLIEASMRFLRPGGLLLITCAGQGRESHSAIDGGPVQSGEWYCNLTVAALCDAIEGIGFVIRLIETNQHWRDIYAAAFKP